MRGLTSHARHVYELGKEEPYEFCEEKNDEGSLWKVLGGIGVFLL